MLRFDVLPAWRRAKLRRRLVAAEQLGRCGEACPGEHRAVARRWARGRAAMAVPAAGARSGSFPPERGRGKRHAISAEERRIIWTAILRHRGTAAPARDLPGVQRGAQTRAWEEADAACRAAGLPAPSRFTIHSWFNYDAAPPALVRAGPDSEPAGPSRRDPEACLAERLYLGGRASPLRHSADLRSAAGSWTSTHAKATVMTAPNPYDPLLRDLLAGWAASAEAHAPSTPAFLGAAQRAIHRYCAAAPDGDEGHLPAVAVLLRLAGELVIGAGAADRPEQAAAELVGALGSLVGGGDPERLRRAVDIAAEQRAAEARLAPILRDGADPVLLRAMIDRLTLALARAIGSPDEALLFLMTTVDRCAELPDQPPAPPAGLKL